LSSRKRFIHFYIFTALISLVFTGMLFPASSRAEKNTVRVLLTKLNLTNQLSVSLDGSYTIGNVSFQRGSKLLLSCETGTIMLYYEGMAFDAGSSVTMVRHALEQEGENGVRLNGAYPLYCGDLQVSMAGRQLRAILHIPVEEYLLGVVPYEMSDSFPLEALKAQAIAARTYAMKRIGSDADYDMVDNTNDQVYRGFQKENKNAIQAVSETAGICGYSKNELANCYYTASNGGQTELPEHVWGKREAGYSGYHTDPYDVENPESVVKRAILPKSVPDGIVGNARFTEEIKLLAWEALSAQGFTGEAEDVRIITLEALEMVEPRYGKDSLLNTKLRMGLRVSGKKLEESIFPEDTEMNIFQLQGEETPSGSTPTASPKPVLVEKEASVIVDVPVFTCLEPLLNLSINGSNNEIITVREEEKEFIIEARRYGHGVGLSQRGAQWMADKYDWKYDQILRFYYPGLEFKKTDTKVPLPSPIGAAYLTTPGPAATPTPRPTLMPATATLQPGEWRVKVTQIGQDSSLNLRSAPSTDAEVLRLLYYGQELIAVKRLEDGWLQVKTDVLEGYVMEKFVEKID